MSKRKTKITLHEIMAAEPTTLTYMLRFEVPIQFSRAD